MLARGALPAASARPLWTLDSLIASVRTAVNGLVVDRGLLRSALARVPAFDATEFRDRYMLRYGRDPIAERVLSALADRSLIVRDAGHVKRVASAELLAAESKLLAARFAALRAADGARAEAVARYVTSRHGSAPAAPSEAQMPAHGVR